MRMKDKEKGFLYLVTGGSGSGKSELAEDIIVKKHREAGKGTLYYVASMYPYDEECLRKIDRHRRKRREKGFVTVECYTHLETVALKEGDAVLLECLSNLVANERYRREGRIKGEEKEELLMQLRESIVKPLLVLADKAACVVAVTNEVFSDGCAYEEETLRYIRLLAKANRMLAEEADCVIEAVYGIPVVRKGELPC